MNRSITAAWQPSIASTPGAQSGPSSSSGKRRAQISLNKPIPAGFSPVPPAGSAAAAALARKQAGNGGQDGDPGASDAGNSSGYGTPTTEGAQLGSPSISGTSIHKRKARPSHPSSAPGTDALPENSTSKRLRRAVPAPSSSIHAGGSRKGKERASNQAIADKYAPPSIRFSSLGGITAAIEQCLELIALPLLHPEIYAHTGIVPPRGVLLHGPPGCGKTRLAQAIAGEMGVPFLNVSAPSIVSGTSGESEKGLRDLFEEAARVAPCIVFLDEIDAITPKRENAQREMERRIVAQLLTCLDDMSWEKTEGKAVMVIGATNRPDSLDPALRRAGRFDHEITLGVPDEDGREQILRVLASHLRLSGDFEFRELAKATPGFVGADLTALTSTAGIVAVKRIFQTLAHMDSLATSPQDTNSAGEEAIASGSMAPATSSEGSGAAKNEGEDVNMESADQEEGLTAASLAAPVETSLPLPPPVSNSIEVDSASNPRTPSSLLQSLPDALQHSTIASFLRRFPRKLSEDQLSILSITNEDFTAALPMIQPSSKREGFATVPDVTWADVGALHETREELSMAIVQPIRRPELFRAVGVSASSGVMLWGPPGCGKTLLAKAVANESRANFISVKGPELLNKYVGESERAVRQVFARARASSPCVIFFDELDALVPKRDDALSEASSRVVNTLLTELDGLEGRGQTYVIAATNRPDIVDPAMCRPGRLDKLLYVDLPNSSERLEILRALTKASPLLTEMPAQSTSDAVVNLHAIAFDPRTDGFSGADLAALVREAAVAALRETIRFSLTAEAVPMNTVQPAAPGQSSPQIFITQPHFLAALDKVRPSVSMAQRKRYESLRTRLSGGHLGSTKAGVSVTEAHSAELARNEGGSAMTT
ncbi:AAA-domain-containing protein [Tilletiaria anomala UBC 951]|uniref:Peroxisomal ATPase PEX1 n=1 Tax=Tilletiaria anomala (strain ATCC 24038 / CBS 436.72 / UBC 951) TaxID=1037660 RepID=A0A066VGW5_TILAU|nr:AAA-domain-containing protein [Tilletiaria anomala UBC 951]KDN37994.1 AAA-domain-containing protein [Tilletiaria anomala UBC 951]